MKTEEFKTFSLGLFLLTSALSILVVLFLAFQKYNKNELLSDPFRAAKYFNEKAHKEITWFSHQCFKDGIYSDPYSSISNNGKHYPLFHALSAHRLLYASETTATIGWEYYAVNTGDAPLEISINYYLEDGNGFVLGRGAASKSIGAKTIDKAQGVIEIPVEKLPLIKLNSWTISSNWNTPKNGVPDRSEELEATIRNIMSEHLFSRFSLDIECLSSKQIWAFSPALRKAIEINNEDKTAQ